MFISLKLPVLPKWTAMTAKALRKLAYDSLKIAAVGGLALMALFGNPVELYEQGGWPLLWSLFWKNGLATAVFWLGNGYISDLGDRWLPWTEAPLKRLFIGIFLTVAYTSVAYVFVAWMWSFGDFGWDLPALVRNLQMRMFVPTMVITFIISLFLHGRSFLLNWKRTLVEAEQLKKEHISARYETLKSQVNPHFLFNSLNVLTSLVHRDPDLAEKFIRQLSNVYRYILDSRDQETVSLEAELQTLRDYLFLMEIRFGPALQASISIPPGTNGSIAPLTLQMLVENALKHNEVSKAHPLQIDVYLEDREYVVVRNNLQKKGILPESTSLGLANIRARYRIMAGKEVWVSASDGFFTVKVPLLR
jgi:hypothetical protein